MIKLLLINALIFGLFVNNLFGQVNIASAATLSTSYVSSWETLSAINDGFEPASSTDHTHGAYGNWQSGVTNQWNWVQYTFNQFYKIARSDVYWWTDYNGIIIPYNSYIQYWDISQTAWVRVSNPSGYGYEIDKYNTTTFDTVLTNKIRLNFVSTIAQGILEWKVFGVLGEQIPSLSTVSISPALAKGTTSIITVTAHDKNNNPVKDYVFKLDANILDALSLTNEAYVINGQSITDSTKNIALPATDALGVITFSVSVPATIDPTDGIELALKFNEGYTLLKSYKFVEPGLLPPALTADAASNNVDNDIEITFTDDVAWRGAITGVSVSGSPLKSSNYTLSSGILTMKPSVENKLSSVGVQTVLVKALGYNDAQVYQNIMAGAVDTAVSSISSQFKLFKSVNIPFTVKAADKFGNPVSGYVFKWDATLINTNITTNESYTVNGVSLTSSLSDQALTATNASGLTTFNVSIPTTVDLNDGIEIKLKTSSGSYLKSEVNYVSTSTEKQIYIDNTLKTTEWSYSKSAQSDNFIIFWGGLVGTDPLHPANGSTDIAFDPTKVLASLEGLLKLYVDSFGFITNKNQGNMGKYKFLIIMTNTWNNSVYVSNGTINGGSTDGVIGAMWITPNATGGSGFLIAHEFAHMCQAMIPIQYSGKGIKDPDDGSYNLGMFWESHANFMAITASGDVASANPQRFVNTAMMHFSSTNHYYENNYFLQYLFEKYGMETINLIWRNATQAMHPLVSLKNNKGWSQNQLNDEFGNYAMKQVTWDYTIKGKVAMTLKNQGYPVVCREYTVPDTSKTLAGAYVVPRHLAPADYGYNIIPLYPNSGASKITITFSGYANAPAGGAGWRYGFVAVDQSSNPRYSNLFSATSGEASFDITPDDKSIYFIVTGAPQTHHNYVWTPGWPKVYRYPYKFTISGALPAGYKPGYNSRKNDYPGAAHANGGGWVASTASVASTAYVGPNAQVLGSAKVSGNARIEDYAIVTDNAEISENAIVRGNSMVGSTSKVRGNAIVDKSARVFYKSDIYGDALITGSAIVYSSSVSGNAVVKDLAWLNNATLSGIIVVGGDAENFTSCSAGIYLQSYGLRNCDGLESSTYNTDVNPNIDEYSVLTRPVSLSASNVTDSSATLNWVASSGGYGNITYLLVSGTSVVKTKNSTMPLTGLQPKTAYKYTVIARDSEGNQSLRSNECTVITLATGIKVNEKPEGYQIYPVPTQDYVHVKFPKSAGDLTYIKVFNYQGILVFASQTNDEDFVIDIRNLNGGEYIVQIYDKTHFVVDKLVKQ